MVLSKPVFYSLGVFMDQLFNHPVRTSAISCCLLSTAGNYTSQCLAGKSINTKALMAYGAFGLLFGGTIPHYFYSWLDNFVPEEAAFQVSKKLFLEGLVYSPLYQGFMLYSLARFEGKDHKMAMNELKHLHWVILASSWKYLTLVQLLNFTFVPPLLRMLIINLIAFFWTIYVSQKREQQTKKQSKH